jgi:hypothetical protein
MIKVRSIVLTAAFFGSLYNLIKVFHSSNNMPRNRFDLDRKIFLLGKKNKSSKIIGIVINS